MRNGRYGRNGRNGRNVCQDGDALPGWRGAHASELGQQLTATLARTTLARTTLTERAHTRRRGTSQMSIRYLRFIRFIRYHRGASQVDVSFADIVSHKPDGEWIDIAPMRVLSFDIE